MTLQSINLQGVKLIVSELEAMKPKAANFAGPRGLAILVTPPPTTAQQSVQMK